jgi:hypothetical protein
MSTFLVLLFQMLGDMGVPGAWSVAEHLDPAHQRHVPERVGPAESAPSYARAAPAEWQKAPREFDRTTEISNGF